MPSESLIYWDSVDFESEDYSDFSNNNSPNAKSRKYVDPWDLENYAYMRKHLESSTPDLSGATASLIGEPTDSTFYYISGMDRNHEPEPTYNLNSIFYPTESLVYSTTARYAGIDEASFRNDGIIYESKRCLPRIDQCVHTNKHGSTTETDSESDETDQTVSEPFVYQEALQETKLKRRRSVAVPLAIESMTYVHKPRRHSMANHDFVKTKYEKPKYVKSSTLVRSSAPNYDYEERSYPEEIVYDSHPRTNQMYLMEPHYESNRQYLEDYYKTMLMPMPIYDERTVIGQKPDNFSLSNYGHLKIDYSFSWNTLDRFIKK